MTSPTSQPPPLTLEAAPLYLLHTLEQTPSRGLHGSRVPGAMLHIRTVGSAGVV